jgi:hypothetical protein
MRPSGQTPVPEEEGEGEGEEGRSSRRSSSSRKRKLFSSSLFLISLLIDVSRQNDLNKSPV